MHLTVYGSDNYDWPRAGFRDKATDGFLSFQVTLIHNEIMVCQWDCHLIWLCHCTRTDHNILAIVMYIDINISWSLMLYSLINVMMPNRSSASCAILLLISDFANWYCAAGCNRHHLELRSMYFALLILNKTTWSRSMWIEYVHWCIRAVICQYIIIILLSTTQILNKNHVIGLVTLT